MSSALLPHVPVGRLFGLIEAMAETPGPDDLYRLAHRLRLPLDELHPSSRPRGCWAGPAWRTATTT